MDPLNFAGLFGGNVMQQFVIRLDYANPDRAFRIGTPPMEMPTDGVETPGTAVTFGLQGGGGRPPRPERPDHHLQGNAHRADRRNGRRGPFVHPRHRRQRDDGEIGGLQRDPVPTDAPRSSACRSAP
jgi:hypothetical protein